MPGTRHIGLWVVFAVSLLAYGLTMPRHITLEDAGLFQMVCQLGGLSHPPGYPLFTVLCQSVLPGDADVIYGNFLSAIFAATAVSLLYEICLLETDDWQIALCVSLGMAFSSVFWSQAIIIEVYSLAVALFLVCWLLLAKYRESRDSKYWFGACFAYGLGLANHWPLLLLSSPALLLFSWPVLRHLTSCCRSPGFLLSSVGIFLLGLTPYLSLLLQTDPVISVTGGIHSMSDLVSHVSRGSYDFQVESRLADRVGLSVWLLQSGLLQLGYLGAPFILLGLGRSMVTLPLHRSLGLIVLFLGSTIVLVLLVDFQNNHTQRALFWPYPIIAYVAVAYWFGYGVTATIAVIKTVGGSIRHAFVLLVLVGVAMLGYVNQNRSQSVFVEQFTKTVLASMPADATLIVEGDNQTGPFGYLHLARGLRPDIELLNWDSAVFANRLTPAQAKKSTRESAFVEYINTTRKRVFVINPVLSPVTDFGAYFEFNPAGNSIDFKPELEVFLDTLLTLYEQNLVMQRHEQSFLFDRLWRFAGQYVRYASSQNPKDIPALRRNRLVRLLEIFPGKLALLENQFEQGLSKPELLALISQAEMQIPEFASQGSLGLFYDLSGRTHLLTPENRELAIVSFQRSLDAYPQSDNRSICALHKLLKGGAAAARLSQRFPSVSCPNG